MMVNNIPVNGWPQLKDLEAVQPTLDRLDKIEAWKRTVKEETFTGEELTIENALALPARSLITSINAIQDLHGLPFPYVGGAYKNKLPMTVSAIKAANTTGTWTGNVYAINNGTIEILTDNADNVTGFKVNGTFSSGTSFNIISSLTLPQVNYVMSGSSDFNNDFFIAIQASGGNVIATTTDVTITGTITNALCWIRIGTNVTVSNKTIQPMIRLATESDPTFAPYSNICPISGRDSVVLTRSDGDEISEDFTIQFGQTVYGADINWDTGVMTVKTALVTYDENSGFVKFDTVAAGTRYVLYDPVSPLAEVTTNNFSDIISNRFKDVTRDAVNLGEIALRASSTPQWLMVVSDKTTIEAFNADIAATNIQVEYPLATPTAIQLTPEQLEMLKGYNRVTLSDGYGTIELKALTGANWS